MAPPKLPARRVAGNDVEMVKTAIGPMSARAYDFAVKYVKAGGRGAGKIALECGYSSATTASDLLRNEKVLAVIEQECKTSLRAAIVEATATIKHLMISGGTGDGVRLKAAESILDRCSKLLAKVTEHKVTVEDKRAPDRGVGERLVEFLTNMAPDLGITITDPDKLRHFAESTDRADSARADVIDADYEEVEDEPEDAGRAGLEDLLS